MADEKDIHVADPPMGARRDSVGTMDKIIHNAKSATEKERKMSLWQGIKLYPKAVGWSVLISTCIAMEGYDVCLLSNFYGFPQFQRKYGEQLPDGSWQITAPWQAGLSNGMMVGEIIGLFINGFVSERFGYRYTVMTCLVLIIAFTAIFFTAQTVVHLLVAEILCGIPWGVFQTLTITYASEVCPVALRGYREYPRSFKEKPADINSYDLC
jgi:SP family general alpha glucoside:H+ symporter-like MFS transporter